MIKKCCIWYINNHKYYWNRNSFHFKRDGYNSYRFCNGKRYNNFSYWNNYDCNRKRRKYFIFNITDHSINIFR